MIAGTVPVAVTIGAVCLRDKAAGETIEARFRSIIEPRVLDEACWACRTEDEQFRAAVGGLMLSYGSGTPEFARIEAEMRLIQTFSAFLTAAEAGLDVAAPDVSGGDQPIGLLGIWATRQKTGGRP